MGVLSIKGKSPFSIIKTKVQTVFGSKRVTGASAETEAGAGAAYAKNLTRLIPGEALSLYAAGNNIQVPASMQDVHIWPVYCVVAAILFRWAATREKGSWKPQFSAIAISVVSFLLWLYTQGDWLLRFQIPADEMYLVKYTMLLWIFVLPAFVGGDKPDKGEDNTSADEKEEPGAS